MIFDFIKIYFKTESKYINTGKTNIHNKQNRKLKSISYTWNQKKYKELVKTKIKPSSNALLKEKLVTTLDYQPGLI